MHMKTIEEIRKENLARLIQSTTDGNITKFSTNIDKSHSQISQIINASTTETGKPKGMGSNLAREIEKKLRLERGWMDHDHGECAPLYTTNDPLVARAMQIMEPMPTYAKELEIRSLAEKTQLIELTSANAEQRNTNNGKK